MSSESATGDRRRILVGVDGSEDGLRAVRYAAGAARATGSGVWIVNIVDLTAMVAGLWEMVVPIDELRQVGERFVSDAADLVLAEGLPVSTEVIPGHPAQVLSELSAQAGLLVVGRRSISGLSRMFVGSTSVAVAGRAQCPVVVISASSTPEPTGGHGVVAVALGTLPPRSSALEWGAVEAAHRRAKLRVVHVLADGPATDAARFATGAADLEALLSSFREAHPDIVVETELAVGTPIDELILRTSQVDLMILGMRPDKLSGLARGVLAHAECPVGLIR